MFESARLKRMPNVVLILASGHRLSLQVKKPNLSLIYRSQAVDYVFDLWTVDEALRFVYRQRDTAPS